MYSYLVYERQNYSETAWKYNIIPLNGAYRSGLLYPSQEGGERRLLEVHEAEHPMLGSLWHWKIVT
jgi:hypothetical protein